MRIKVALTAAAAVLAIAVVAEAHVVPYGLAKREIRRETAALCASTNGCVNWKVGQCRRQSYHRVDCVSRLVGENGVRCSFVVIARAPANLYEVNIHHKRVLCD